MHAHHGVAPGEEGVVAEHDVARLASDDGLRLLEVEDVARRPPPPCAGSVERNAVRLAFRKAASRSRTPHRTPPPHASRPQTLAPVVPPGTSLDRPEAVRSRAIGPRRLRPRAAPAPARAPAPRGNGMRTKTPLMLSRSRRKNAAAAQRDARVTRRDVAVLGDDDVPLGAADVGRLAERVARPFVAVAGDEDEARAGRADGARRAAGRCDRRGRGGGARGGHGPAEPWAPPARARRPGPATRRAAAWRRWGWREGWMGTACASASDAPQNRQNCAVVVRRAAAPRAEALHRRARAPVPASTTRTGAMGGGVGVGGGRRRGEARAAARAPCARDRSCPVGPRRSGGAAARRPAATARAGGRT